MALQKIGNATSDSRSCCLPYDTVCKSEGGIHTKGRSWDAALTCPSWGSGIRPISAMLVKKSLDHFVLRNSITPEFMPVERQGCKFESVLCIHTAVWEERARCMICAKMCTMCAYVHKHMSA